MFDIVAPFATKPGFLPSMPKTKGSKVKVVAQNKVMWQKLFALDPRMSFGKRATRAVFERIVKEVMPKWKKKLSAENQAEFVDASVKRLRRQGRSIAIAHERREHGWVSALGLGKGEEESEVVGGDAALGSADGSAPAASRRVTRKQADKKATAATAPPADHYIGFSWETKRAWRKLGDNPEETVPISALSYKDGATATDSVTVTWGDGLQRWKPSRSQNWFRCGRLPCLTPRGRSGVAFMMLTTVKSRYANGMEGRLSASSRTSWRRTRATRILTFRKTFGKRSKCASS